MLLAGINNVGRTDRVFWEGFFFFKRLWNLSYFVSNISMNFTLNILNILSHFYVWCLLIHKQYLSGGTMVNNSPVNGEGKRWGFNPWAEMILWSRRWKPIPIFLPGECHGQKRPEGSSPWGGKELDMTERVRKHKNITLF